MNLSKNLFKKGSLHAPNTGNTFQFKQKNMTDNACFHCHVSSAYGVIKIPLVLLAFAITLKGVNNLRR